MKWAIAIQAMRAAPGSRTNAAPSAANEYTTVPAVQRTRHRSVASGGGEPPPVDVRSEAGSRCPTGGPRVRVVGGGQEQPRTHPLLQEEYGEHNLEYQEYPPKTAILAHVPSRSVCP